jgi:hypothetical protein
MGRGAMAAHQTLDLWILVRIQAPQLVDSFMINCENRSRSKSFMSERAERLKVKRNARFILILTNRRVVT